MSPRRGSATETFQSLNETNSSLFLAVLVAVFFWIAVTGLSILQSIVSVAILVGVGVWGLVLVKLLAPSLIHQSDLPLWLFGPCVGMGAMSLFLLRVVTSESIFLIIFLLVPATWIVFSLQAAARKPQFGCTPLASLQNTMRTSLLFIGLAGITLLRGWDWAIPITAVAIVLAMFLSIKVVRNKPVLSYLIFCLVLPTCWWVLGRRNQFWWMMAEGIPFDETILETISKGLIRWGPTEHPLYHGVSGASAATYHFLLYLITGLLDRFARPGPYEALLLLGPIITSFGICSSIALLSRVLIRKWDAHLHSSPIAIAGLIACLFALRGEGFGSPSTWFGIASLAGNLVLIVCISRKPPNFPELLLIAFSIITVAFSKGVFVYATALIAISFSIFSWKTLWKVAVTASTTTVLSIVWFKWASIPADQFVIEFWPYRNWQSQFSFDLYTFRVFFKQLISPVILGITCAVMVYRSKLIIFRQLSLTLVVILGAATVSQLFITSSGPRSFELFYVPGIFAAAVLFLVLAVSTCNSPASSFWQVAVVFVLALSVVKYSPPLGIGTISPFTVATTLIGAFFGVTRLIDRFGFIGNRFRSESFIPLVSVFLILVATMTFASQDFPEFPQYTRAPIGAQYADWFGSPEFIEVTDFIQQETSAASLFALAVCVPDSDQSCSFDFRPAALFGRRLLASEPLFSRDAVSDRLWGDIETSRAIGFLLPNEVIESMIISGVNYVFIDLAKVDTKWVQNAKTAGAIEVFSNPRYSVLSLKKN